MHPKSNIPAVACWNPIKPRYRGRIGRRLPFTAPVNNFGDILGPIIVQRILQNAKCTVQRGVSFDEAEGHWKLLSIGSVLHFARDGDLIWGTGLNGKIPESKCVFSNLDIRMVRGPLTREFLINRGIEVPEVYGDPGLLVPHLFPEKLARWNKASRGPIFVPNLNDPRPKKISGHLTDPRQPIWDIIKAIYESEFVLSSSLHGFVLAEAFGVPTRLIQSQSEAPFKYDDYFWGTGRQPREGHTSPQAALAAPDYPAPVFNPEKMIEAFPIEHFRNANP
jgi:pyruvyltransferase